MGPWESGEEFVAPQVTFQDLGDLSFIADNMDMIGITDGATAGTGGGRYGKADFVSFNNVGNIEFRGLNHGGIGFSRLNSLAFTNTGDISFTDMKMGYSSHGGAIFINQGGILPFTPNLEMGIFLLTIREILSSGILLKLLIT
ncbi:hypothetical protein [Akkermansia muciniphila]|nr:hypothetical protein [Akkermansia muciniphila]QAA64794.1 hypothetical protein C1O60_08850 [Akkermansia muciniphila]